MSKSKKKGIKKGGRITLKDVAQRVGLAPATVSIVLNDTPRARVIPQRTKDRIFEMARELEYQPNPFARALRAKQQLAKAYLQDSAHGAGTLMFVGAGHYSRAIQAIRNAGLRVPGDVSVVDVSTFQVSAFELASPKM